MKKMFIVVFCLVLFPLFQKGNATNCYVDFDNGNDANSGLSQASSWKNIPGTMNKDDTGWVPGSSGWRRITQGDIILIKSGTTHDSIKGGRILISSSWYDNGTAVNPITIKRDTTWGSGQIVIDGTSITVREYWALFYVQRIDYVVLDGVVPNGIKIQNSAYNGYSTIGNHTTIKYVEVYNSTSANVRFASSNYPTVFLQGAVIDHVVAHKTNTADDTAGNIYLVYVDGAVISNSVAYDAPTGADGIHLGSCKNSWVLNCSTYFNGEQGIDISRDGDYKTRDDSYNITVRDCVSYDNYKMNYDVNSASRNIYFIKCVGWKTTTTETGDGNFMVYAGGNRTFFINCTSSAGYYWGYAFAWWNLYYNLGAGSYNQYIINCITSGDSNQSVNVEPDYSGRSFAVNYYNSNLNSVGGTVAVSDKGAKYTRDNINNGTGGWSGINCKAVDPLFIASGNTWEERNLGLKPSSPCIDAGIFPFTTSSSGSGTTISLNKLVSDLDVSRVFRPGDRIQIEGAGQYVVASVDSTSQVTITSSASWLSGKGVWFPWSGQRPDMGAYEFVGSDSPPNPPTGLRILNP